MSTDAYDWAGTTILFDTFCERCRWILKDTADDASDNDVRLFVKTDARDMIARGDNWEMKEIVKELRRNYNLPVEREQGTFDARALACWKWMADNIEFVKDGRSQDFWQRPAETYSRRKGDCEDNAIMLASLLIASGISTYNVRVTIGTVHDGDNGELGHVWVMYRAEDGGWRIMDVLTNNASIPTAFAPSANAGTPYGEYRPALCFNRDHVWGIGPIKTWASAVPEVFNINELGDQERRVIQPAEINPVEVEFMKIDLVKIDPEKVEPAKIEPLKVDPLRTAPAKINGKPSYTSRRIKIKS